MAGSAVEEQSLSTTIVPVVEGVFCSDSGNVIVCKHEDVRKVYELGCYGSSATTASLKPLFMRKKRRRFRDLDADANHVEPWKLTLLEAFYLMSQNQLEVVSGKDGKTLSKEEAWAHFRQSSAFSSPRRFAVMYMAYKHLRDQKWVIKMGQTYGGHFAIYQGDPDFFHSQFCVVVRDVEETANTWLDITREMRVANQTGKELMVCEVSDLADDAKPDSTANVEFAIMLRWVLQHEQVGKERQPHRKLAQKLIDPAQKVAQHKNKKRKTTRPPRTAPSADATGSTSTTNTDQRAV